MNCGQVFWSPLANRRNCGNESAQEKTEYAIVFRDVEPVAVVGEVGQKYNDLRQKPPLRDRVKHELRD